MGQAKDSVPHHLREARKSMHVGLGGKLPTGVMPGALGTVAVLQLLNIPCLKFLSQNNATACLAKDAEERYIPKRNYTLTYSDRGLSNDWIFPQKQV